MLAAKSLTVSFASGTGEWKTRTYSDPSVFVASGHDSQIQGIVVAHQAPYVYAFEIAIDQTSALSSPSSARHSILNVVRFFLDWRG
jgi:hypothetical protein